MREQQLILLKEQFEHVVIEIVSCVEAVVDAKRQRCYLMRDFAVRIPIDNGNQIAISHLIRYIIRPIHKNEVAIVNNTRILHLNVLRRLKIDIVAIDQLLEQSLKLKAWGHYTPSRY